MKKSFLKTATAIITLVLVFALAACGGNGNKPSIPSNDQFKDVGIPGGFTASVKGDLTASDVSAEEGVFLKWSGSDETSLNNVITWLQANGYDKYDGENSAVETMLNGAYKVYTSSKIIGGDTMEAVAMYFVKDTTIEGQSFKAGDLYIGIAPAEDNTITPPETLTSWPTSQIAGVLGANRLPVYAGAASVFTFASNTNLATAVTVTINGAVANDEQGYKSLLLSSGYTEETLGYRKSFGSDTVTVIVVGANGGTEYKITVTATLSSESGGNAWPTSQLASAFPNTGVTIPSYDGATSFEFSNSSGVVIIKAHNATDGIDSYKTKLIDAGFTEKSQDSYQKEANNDKILSVSLGDVSTMFAGQVWITVTLTNKPAAPVLHYTLPQNVKVQIFAGGYTTTVIKIGDDYYSALSLGSTVSSARFLKHNGGTWTEYEKAGSSAWQASGNTYNASSVIDKIESTYYFGYMTSEHELSGMSRQGQQTIAGTPTDIYVKVDFYPGTNLTVYVHSGTGLLFKELYTGTMPMTWEVTLYNTSIIAFDVAIPT